LADAIIVESPNLASQITLNKKYYHKPILNGALFVDTKVFSPQIKFFERTETLSYFGALTEHKGIINFLEAVPLIWNHRNNIQFIIGGAGSTFPKVQKHLSEIQIGNDSKVVLAGIIPHAKMPKYLNQSKLVIIPSYGEGLPNIVLEAMACGTPVLATPVGGIPDVIKDGETGFIMEDNSPKCISRNVIRALNHPNLEQIGQNARALMEREFTFEKAVERWRVILAEVYNERK